MCCTAVNKSLSVSEMAEKGRRSYFNDDYLNTKVQKEKQLRKVQEKNRHGAATEDAGGVCHRRKAVRLASECQCLPVEGQMVRNNFCHCRLNSSARQLSASRQEGRQEQVSPLLASSAGSHRVFGRSLRDYCSDSGMVLTTWAASGAVGGEPKNVLV